MITPKIGYLGQPLKFILRKKSFYADTSRAKLQGASVIISQYEELRLDGDEKLALGDIRAMISAYRNSIDDAAELVKIGHSSTEINAMVKFDDQPALNALEFLYDTERHQLHRSSHVMNRRQILESLRAILGYGGMIHNFKNFILRGDPALVAEFEKQSNKAQQLLSEYRARTDKPVELAALASIGAVLKNYQTSQEGALNFSNRGLSPSEINAQIAVDDRPAFQGLIQLGRQIGADKVVRARRRRRYQGD